MAVDRTEGGEKEGQRTEKAKGDQSTVLITETNEDGIMKKSISLNVFTRIQNLGNK